MSFLERRPTCGTGMDHEVVRESQFASVMGAHVGLVCILQLVTLETRVRVAKKKKTIFSTNCNCGISSARHNALWSTFVMQMSGKHRGLEFLLTISWSSSTNSDVELKMQHRFLSLTGTWMKMQGMCKCATRHALDAVSSGNQGVPLSPKFWRVSKKVLMAAMDLQQRSTCSPRTSQMQQGRS